MSTTATTKPRKNAAPTNTVLVDGTDTPAPTMEDAMLKAMAKNKPVLTIGKLTVDELNKYVSRADSAYGRKHKRAVELELIKGAGKRSGSGQALGRSDFPELRKLEPFSPAENELVKIAVALDVLTTAIAKLAKLDAIG